MQRYVPPQFVGLTGAQLQANLQAAQTAYAALASGQKVVRAGYAQGDGGTKEVTYYLSDQTIGALQQYMASIAQLLSPGPHSRYRRRPLRNLFT